VPVPFGLAALGGKMDVPTLNGDCKLTLPEATQTGERFRVRGAGIPDVHGGSPGELVVEVYVETPKGLSDRARELMEELREIEVTETASAAEEEDGEKKKWKLFR
jgi:molecular chaperone DnaJ